MKATWMVALVILVGCKSAPTIHNSLPERHRGEIIRIRALVGEKWTDDEAMRIKVQGLITSAGLDPKKFRLIESRVEEVNSMSVIYRYQGFASVVYEDRTLQEVESTTRWEDEPRLSLNATAEERQMMREAVASVSWEKAFKLLEKEAIREFVTREKK